MKRKRISILFFVLWFFSFHMPAQTFEGIVCDGQNKKRLSDVYVSVNGKQIAQTDSLGQFSFQQGENVTFADVMFYHYGYTPKTIQLMRDTNIVVELEPIFHQLGEVTITAYRTRRGNNSYSYSVSDVKKIITPIGEADVMRIMQVLPGISQGMEGGMGFYVRGGNNGNNRVELDGVPIVAPSHLFGLFSTFHSDIVDKSSFQLGGIRASSGDLLSSLLYIQTIRPEFDTFKGSTSVSPLMYGAALQGYIIKGKLSFQVATRTSLLKTEYELIKRLAKESTSAAFNPQVQDYYGKLSWRLNDTHTIDLMAYRSNDSFSFTPEEENNVSNYDILFGWNNRVLKLGWNWQITPGMKAETYIYHNHFNTRQRQREASNNDNEGKYGIFLASEKDEWAVKSQLIHIKGKWNTLGGIDYRNQQFSPVMQKIQVSSKDEISSNLQYATSLATLFAESGYEKENKSKFRGGVRYNLFLNEEHLMHNIEFRLFSSVFLTRQMGIEATFDQLTQFQHTLEGLPVGWALDLLVPASKKFRPERSNQYYLGSFWGDGQYYISAGTYYKILSNVTSYRSLLNQFSTRNVSWEEDVVQGKGKSFGFELWFERRNSRWNGSMAYTLSKTTRRFAEINGGAVYPFKFDRPHNFNIQSQWQTVKKEHQLQYLNTSLYFMSGNTLTHPVASYHGESLPFWENREGGIHVPPMEDYHARVRTEMSSKNGYRLPNYFRIDIGYNFLWKRKRTTHEFSISVFNVLNRHNPILIFYEDDTWKQLSILPVIPSIRWELRF